MDTTEGAIIAGIIAVVIMAVLILIVYYRFVNQLCIIKLYFYNTTVQIEKPLKQLHCNGAYNHTRCWMYRRTER
jgi:hypothetical protein